MPDFSQIDLTNLQVPTQMPMTQDLPEVALARSWAPAEAEAAAASRASVSRSRDSSWRTLAADVFVWIPLYNRLVIAAGSQSELLVLNKVIEDGTGWKEVRDLCYIARKNLWKQQVSVGSSPGSLSGVLHRYKAPVAIFQERTVL